MTPAARAQAAIEILDVILDGAPAEAALIRWSRSSRFAGSGDRAAVRDLVFAALRRRRSLGALGGSATGRGLILGLLRAAGTPPDELFTGHGHAPAPLTVAEREGGRDPTPAEALDLPDWVAQRLAAELGPDLPVVAEALRHRAPVWLRINAARTDASQAAGMLSRDGIETQPATQCPTALRVTAGERGLQSSRAFRDGLVELQDLAPQIACAAVPLAPGATVLDYCAGGGGKALALAARGASVTAWDASPARMRDLPARARRTGATINRAPDRGPDGRYDVVLTDVPCSGSGTWRRTPDAKWRLSAEQLDSFPATQLQIMENAAQYLRPGGRLVYMTCSLFAAENQGVISRFLSAHQRFALESSLSQRPGAGEASPDGFFHAILRDLTGG
ncbi:RsmB/NOP family class I SAM-dependent RNA methyltransferase [Paracoccus luteus]|uniref:RsmB/NOP family class I SAM-dependent RNA methyltransferase n=1 Tax=Paracoccus luteus TaxID=2508543 RepID=UPI00106FA6ED